MTTLYLVRHGHAAAGWGKAEDPGLDDLGRKQARKVAAALQPKGPLEVISSPLKRALETAQFTADRWGCEICIEPRVGEIAWPGEKGLVRSEWLDRVLSSNWSEMDQALRSWRESLLEALREIERDTVVFTHFVAINTARGHAKQDERVVSFHPDNCSVTIIELPQFRVL